MFNRTIITVAAAVALGCMPVATNALATPAVVTAADNAGGGYARGGHSARYGGGYYGGTEPIYDSCDGYDGNGPRFLRSLCRRFDKWRAGWLLTAAHLNHGGRPFPE